MTGKVTIIAVLWAVCLNYFCDGSVVIGSLNLQPRQRYCDITENHTLCKYYEVRNCRWNISNPSRIVFDCSQAKYCNQMFATDLWAVI